MNGSKTTQKPRREDNEQVKCDLTVLFSLISIFNLLEWVNCDHTTLTAEYLSARAYNL